MSEISGNRPLSFDASVVRDGRKNALKDVDAPKRDQIVKKLRAKLVEKKIGERIHHVFRAGNADREKWLERQRSFLAEFDEFISEIYDGATDWGSTLHLPTSLTVCKAYHARMQSALIGIDPPFTVKAQKGANSQRAMLIQDLMSYTVGEWANRYTGVASFVDAWLWDWITGGVGLAKVGWETEYTRFTDVEKQTKPAPVNELAAPNGQEPQQPVMQEVEVEVDRTIKAWDCPIVKLIHAEDLLIVGGEGDPQAADYVIEQSYMTASELWQMVDKKVFDNDAVTKVIQSGNDLRSVGDSNQIKFIRADDAGEATVDKYFEAERYQILEAYLKIDVDDSGIASDVIAWVHPRTREILAATYLYRRMPQGRRPFYKIDFYKRKGATYGAGVIELLYSLSKEVDMIHNVRTDIGILTSQPFGFYRPTASMSEEKLPIEPGTMIPLDNPGSDVFFPNLGNRVSFGFQEEAALNQMIDRFMSVSDITFGSMGSQGAARTATGVRSLTQETNANLDVYIRRMHTGWKGILVHLFQLMQIKIEPGFQFRLTGDDGSDYWAQVHSREEIQGMYDFCLEPNSSHSNKQIQQDVANQIYQMTGNPLDMQFGIVTPVERYEAIKNMFQSMGIKDYSRYIRKPKGNVVYTPNDIANAVLSGVDIPMDPTQDLAGFVAFVDYLFKHDETLGQFNEQQTVALGKKRLEAMQLQAAMEQQQAQSANMMQQQANAQQANAMSGPSQAPQNQGAPVAQAPARPVVADMNGA